MADPNESKLGWELLKATGRSASRELTPNQQRAIDQICMAFEKHWDAERSSIENTLQQHPGLRRTNLFESLLAVELELRWQTGSAPQRAEYETRFPEDKPLIARIFVQVQQEIGQTADQSADPSSEIEKSEFAGQGQPPLPTIPGYKVVSELGRGGMGVVYRARQLRLNRAVALKVIARGRSANAAQRNRFRREGEIVATFAHPNIVHVYDAGESNGLSYFASELIEGGTLAGVKTPLRPDEAMRLVAQIADALAVAHANGIVHCDLKPANILLAPSKDGMVIADRKVIPKIADFGLASSLHEEPAEVGNFCGTPDFMSPEQIESAVGVTPATDLHALGLMLYQLLTGVHPFQQPTVEETLARVRHHQPDNPLLHNPKIPVPAADLCLDCLHKDASARMSSASELADRLRQIIQAQTDRKIRRRRLLLTALVGGPIFAAGLMTWLASSPVDRSANRNNDSASEQSLASAILHAPEAWLVARVDGGDAYLGTLEEVKRNRNQIEKIRLPARFRLQTHHLDELAGWKSLRVFEAAHTTFNDRDAQVLSKLPSLELLDLFGSRVTGRGIAAIGDLDRLSSLSIGQTAVTTADIAKLSDLPIEFLNVSGNRFEEPQAIENLSKLSRLKILQVVNGSRRQLERVALLTQVEELRLYPGFFTAEGLASLESMPNLEALDMTVEKLTPSPIDFRGFKKLRRLKLWFKRANHDLLDLQLPASVDTLEVLGDVGDNRTRWADRHPTVDIRHYRLP